MIGKLEPADLRELWKHEALNFTSWLAENCDVLKDQLGLRPAEIATDRKHGLPFHLDGRIMGGPLRPPVAANARRWWKNSAMYLHTALPNRYFDGLGLPRLGM